MRLEQVDMGSLQALVMQEVLEGAWTCNLELSECCVLNKKIKVRFSTTYHRLGGLLDCFHVNILGPTTTALYGSHR